MIRTILTIAVWSIAGAALCAENIETIQPDRTAVQKALEKYLAERGDLCLGKFDWPIDISQRDFELGTRDALQMPVLERLGLVTAAEGSELRKKGDSEQTVAVRRYALTEAGQKFYINRELVRTAPDGEKVVHHGDFCAGKLSLNQVVRWDQPAMIGDHWETTVTYTYKMAPAKWTHAPEIAQVFPMVDRIIKGEGTLQLQQRLQLAGKSWVAVNSVE